MTVSLLLMVILVAAAMPYLCATTKQVRSLAMIGSTSIFLLSLFVGIPALFAPAAVTGAGLWYIDALGGFFVLLIGFVQWTGTLVSMTYMKEEEAHGTVTAAKVKRYFVLLHLFVLAMMLAVVSNNTGIVWVALEGTTLVTTLLVGFYERKESLEAAWKYLILCSSGIAFGFLGILVMFYAASTTGAEGVIGMTWSGSALLEAALPVSVVKIAFVLLLIGFGTKVGLVPMHAWLPDAHSSAPSPISGMLSGVLLNAALLPILRFKNIVDGVAAPGWTDQLLIVFGVLSIALPAAFVLVQRDYKRLLAYSSIEHMGLITLSAGLGAIGSVAATIHIAGHALAKSALFFAAGNILLKYHSTKFENVSGVTRILPYTGGLFLVAFLALLGVPPSPLFASEYFMAAAAIGTHPYATGAVFLALTIVFAGFVRLLMPMLFGESPDRGGRERWNISHTAITLNIVLLIGLGIALWIAPGEAIIQRIAEII
ncbi:MAG: hydrogenase-4 component F [Parcubacteria group bacterium Gr01-1014_8]|nr:MAG: hydrogenase-4 component F [Parcubacteria group bacterium Gr01-1014_8]